MRTAARAPAQDLPHVVVVGGGISGLAAAWHLTHGSTRRVRVTVLEQSPRLGGKVAVSDVAGLPVDAGAESLLLRRPEAIQLVHAVGLGGDVVHPEPAAAALWSRGELHPMPRRTLLGIPGDLRALAASGILSVRGLVRLPLDHVLPRTDVHEDVSVGRYVGARLGREVVDRLVEPILGGVYAGHADALSLDAVLPQLSGAVRVETSLLRGVAEVLAEHPQGPGRPVFASLAGGLGRLPAAVAAASGADVRTGVTVRALERTPFGWRVVTGPTRQPEVLHADAVVLAVPATPAARLLEEVVPTAAAELAGVEYASVAVVTFVLAPPRLGPLTGSGFLVPPVDGTLVKAATYSSSKWRWLADAAGDRLVVRVSVGRHGEAQDLQREDRELARLALRDLRLATGVPLTPVATRVTRWGGALPQYAVGHLTLASRVHRALDEQPGLALAGAALDGVGVPSCVASGKRAAGVVLRQLATRPEWAHGSRSS